MANGDDVCICAGTADSAPDWPKNGNDHDIVVLGCLSIVLTHHGPEGAQKTRVKSRRRLTTFSVSNRAQEKRQLGTWSPPPQKQAPTQQRSRQRKRRERLKHTPATETNQKHGID